MKDEATQETLHADAPALADAPGCAVAGSAETPADTVSNDAFQSAVFDALNETEQDALLRVESGKDDSPIYGGLARRQVVMLSREYHAGTIDSGAFMFAFVWQRSCQKPPASIIEATICYFQNVFGKGGLRLQAQFNRAVIALHDHAPDMISRALVGHANWWKLQILRYMLKKPKPIYLVREFRGMLEAQGLHVGSKEIREFCKKHTIAHDSRPGRPKKNEAL